MYYFWFCTTPRSLWACGSENKWIVKFFFLQSWFGDNRQCIKYKCRFASWCRINRQAFCLKYRAQDIWPGITDESIFGKPKGLVYYCDLYDKYRAVQSHEDDDNASDNRDNSNRDHANNNRDGDGTNNSDMTMETVLMIVTATTWWYQQRGNS